MKENITMSSNRSQISILIILALIVIISIIAVFMFSTEKSSKDQNDDENVGEDFFFETTKTNLEACYEKQIEQAIFNFYKFGASVNQEENNEQTFLSEPALYYDKGKILLPTLQSQVTALEYLMNVSVQECNKEQEFENLGVEITSEIWTVKILPQDNPESAHLEGTLLLQKGEKIQTYTLAEIPLYANMKEMQSIVRELVSKQLEVGNAIPLGALTNLAYEYNFSYEYYFLEESEVMYTLNFHREDNKAFEYNFRAKYEPWEEPIP